MLGGAAARFAEDARCVRVVDDDNRVVIARQLQDLGQLRDRALH